MAKCKITMKNRLAPVTGTMAGPEGSRTGQCPECDTPGVRLSIVGDYIREHRIADTPIPQNGHPSVVTVPAEVTGKGASPTKCTLDGEPISVREHKLSPVAGTVRELIAGEFKGATVKHPVRAGECPECRALVPLSGKGYVTAHESGNTPTPASAQLSERAVTPTDTGAQSGDPYAALQRRTVDLDGAFEAGEVAVPRTVPGDDGKPKKIMLDVPATPEHVEEALAYWKGRRPRSAASKATQSRMVSELVRRRDAMRKGAVVVHADVDAPVTTDVATAPRPVNASMGAACSPEGPVRKEGRGMLPTGAPVVKGRAITPFAGEVTVRQVGDPYERPETPADPRTGYDGRAGTMAGPLGRDRLDKQAATVAPELSGSAKRRNRRNRCRKAYQARLIAASKAPATPQGK